MNVILADNKVPYCTDELFTLLGINLPPLPKSDQHHKSTKQINSMEGDLQVGSNRNSFLTSIAGSMRRIGMGSKALEAALMALNKTQIRPPLPDQEVQQIVKSILRYSPSVSSQTINNNHHISPALEMKDGLIDFSRISPPPRDYAVEDLIVLSKVSVLAGLGGVSKTMLSMHMAVSVALGLPFLDKPTLLGSVILILGEEDSDEIARRFNAIAKIMALTDEQLDLVKSRIKAFPLNGLDARLTRKQLGSLEATEFTDEVIAASNKLHAESKLPVNLIILDHAGLIHGGEFNSREDVVQTMRQVSLISQQSKASVLVLAHSPKTAVGKEKADSNDVAGSAAWVDLARSVFVLRTMDESEAKEFAIKKEMIKNYASLTVVKNNYGPTGTRFWLQRTTVDSHSVSVLEHASLFRPAQIMTLDEQLQGRIISQVKSSHGKYSKRGFVDAHTGSHSLIKAPKRTIQSALDDLIVKGEIVVKKPSEEIRKFFGLHHNIKETLHLKEEV